MSDAAPRLRAVEAFPVDHEGERYLALRDPAGYAPGVILLPLGLLDILAQFDGEHPVTDIQADILRRHGELVRREQIEQLIASLDEHGFLDSPAFAARRRALDRAFLEAPSRPASHAGGAYADDPEQLRATMDSFFAMPDGPGAVDGFRGGGVNGLVAPHIDFHRGGPAYAWAYRDLAERGEADLFVIFGTCRWPGARAKTASAPSPRIASSTRSSSRLSSCSISIAAGARSRSCRC
jgi:hypothetical protein